MQIHHYDPDSGLYAGSGLADPSPLEPDVWLIPAHATAVAPPTVPTGYQAIWSGASWTLAVIPAPPVDPPPTLDEMKAGKIAAVVARVASLIAAGAPVEHGGTTYHVAIGEGSRTDMTAMGTTALATLAGALTWPADYALGWITVENDRIPLPTPAEGLALANACGVHYAAIVQHGRTLKDMILAADEGTLAAIDIDVGWPV